MDLRNVTALARPVRTALGLGVTMTVLGFCAGDLALAQQPGQPGQPPQRQQPQRPQPQRPQQPAQKPPQQVPPAQAPAAAPQAEAPPLVFSPWTKVCGKENQPNVTVQKEVCFTIKEARLDSGQFVANVVLIELEGEPKKILRVTLPLGLLLRNKARMVVDNNTLEAKAEEYNFCLPNGCWADFQVDQEYVAKLKKAQALNLWAVNLNGQAANFGFPLVEFAKANEGPPTDPKELEAQQKKLQEELQRRADEQRKKLEQQGQPQPK